MQLQARIAELEAKWEQVSGSYYHGVGSISKSICRAFDVHLKHILTNYWDDSVFKTEDDRLYFKRDWDPAYGDRSFKELRQIWDDWLDGSVRGKLWRFSGFTFADVFKGNEQFADFEDWECNEYND